MTPTEAVRYLREHGCHAEEREWELGETIMAGFGEGSNEYGIPFLQRVIFLVPATNGWTLFDPDAVATCDTVVPLANACEQVLAILRG